MRAYSLRRVAPFLAVFGFVFSSASWASAQSAPAAPPPVAPAVAPPAPTPQLAAPPPAPPGASPPPAAYPAYPAPGTYPPGAYGAYPPPPPGYAYAYPIARRPPESVAYEGGPIPEGYHLEERPRRGAVIAGVVIDASAYALGLTVASTENFPNSTGWLVVPVLGPWITLASRHTASYSCDVYGCDGVTDDNTTRTFLILDGLTQATGTILLAYGLASTKKVIARDFVGSLHFVPSEIGRNGLGGFVLGQF